MWSGKRNLSVNDGFTYIGLLIIIAIAGIGLSATGITWHNKLRSEKEQELLFVGGQYRKALASYYESAPSGAKVYPASLKELLLDNRYPNTKRHLRKLYDDPITNLPDWGLVKLQGRIVGIYSLSRDKPIKIAGFEFENVKFNDAATYQNWVFGQSIPQELSLSTNVIKP